ncbi:MAG: siderophore-interacting protein [Gammaproteobacteria bacterium]|nr:MAG: siderophore-interacting protein [Gammaproteobacteria bacterium]
MGGRGLVCLCTVLAAASAAAADAVLDRLARMAEAMRVRNYSGVFVYRHGDEVETLRIVHRHRDGRVDERLLTLSGEPREVLRDARGVRCILPDKRLVLIDHRASETRFPGVVPADLDRLPQHYRLELADAPERIAGRLSDRIDIAPRDAYRYGYRLWVDREWDLLTRSDVLDGERVVEQVMFTELMVHDQIPDAWFEPQWLRPGYREKRLDAGDGDDGPPPLSWRAERLPPGFGLILRDARWRPRSGRPVEHLLFSDGMATVSVFIEPGDGVRRGARLDGHRRRGALSLYGRRLGDWRIVVLGDVPPQAVERFAEALVPAEAGGAP